MRFEISEDTSCCVHLLNGNPVLAMKVAEIGVYSFAIYNSVLAELYFGAYNFRKAEENAKRIEEFKRHLNVFSDSEESSKLFGKIKADLRSRGRMIEDFDILIASVAMEHDCVLVTDNIDHFRRIEGLRVENWLG